MCFEFIEGSHVQAIYGKHNGINKIHHGCDGIDRYINTKSRDRFWPIVRVILYNEWSCILKV